MGGLGVEIVIGEWSSWVCGWEGVCVGGGGGGKITGCVHSFYSGLGLFVFSFPSA